MDVLLVPPLNFAMVLPGVYRSGYPNPKNHPFLHRLGLRSVLYLAPDPLSPSNVEFFDRIQCHVFHLPLESNKEPFTQMDPELTQQALALMLNPRHHPMLVHCNKGKHRVGCVVGILRKWQGWSLTHIFEEYKRFSGPKMRLADQEYIELYDYEPSGEHQSGQVESGQVESGQTESGPLL